MGGVAHRHVVYGSFLPSDMKILYQALGKVKSEKGKKVIFACFLLVLIYLFFLSSYQKVVNDATVLADAHCLDVNPLIIARKNSYLASWKILESSGSAEDYWKEMGNYKNLSMQYRDAEAGWLNTQEKFLQRWDYRFLTPDIIKRGMENQYRSRQGELLLTHLTLEAFDATDEAKQKELFDTMMDIKQKLNKTDEDYEWLEREAKKKPLTLLDLLIRIPTTKCPPENFNIPEIDSPFLPKELPSSPVG